MSSYKKVEMPSSSDALKSKLITVGLAVGLGYVMNKVLDFLFKPALEQTDKAKVQEIVTAKQDAREAYLEAIAKDFKDPMYQFQLRFIEEPKAYKKDPDNEVYKTWYNEWKQGNVIDSSLRWVPEVYDKDGSFNPKFLEYMKIQYALHKKAPLIARAKFLNTIRRFYPEFSASLSGLGQDLARYCSMTLEENLQHELIDELKTYGLPDNFAQYLIEKDLGPKELQRQAIFLKSCVDKNFSLSVAKCALENKKTLKEAEFINRVAVEGHMPARVGLAFLNKEISQDDLSDIIAAARDVHNTFELQAYRTNENGSTMFDDVIDSELKKCLHARRAAKVL